MLRPISLIAPTRIRWTSLDFTNHFSKTHLTLVVLCISALTCVKCCLRPTDWHPPLKTKRRWKKLPPTGWFLWQKGCRILHIAVLCCVFEGNLGRNGLESHGISPKQKLKDLELPHNLHMALQCSSQQWCSTIMHLGILRYQFRPKWKHGK